jgi:hypothetical protein
METRDTLQFSEAFRPAVAHILGIARRLTLMMDVRKARAGRAALNIYGVMRRLVRNPDNTHLTVHVEKMRAELRRLRIGRQPKAGHAAPAAPEGEGDDPESKSARHQRSLRNSSRERTASARNRSMAYRKPARPSRMARLTSNV